MKVKPKRILELLEEKNLPVPKKHQLSSYLVSLRVKLYGNSSMSLGELEAWCEQKSVIPDDEDEPWVLRDKIIYGDEINDDVQDGDYENKFRLFVTTKRLLFNATISHVIHANATYKLIWEGFPCLIIGTTDMIKQFHPYGFAVCSNEAEKDFEFIFMSIRDGLQDLNMNMNE
ncbi:unnamed protein product [Didymodactylos carnosus]|uniref:Uncharacterized protein n=1 Tax=Didymodactylos carnosus TaxID=1234261 RepID=A0A814K3J6_9BILA|nr:unnamed protein product [Didymodactylos carnosus]CAF3816065.1 unnamed protein product [Didymodactylos carnosus]